MTVTPKRFRLYFGLLLLSVALAFGLLNSGLVLVHGIKAPITLAYKTSAAGNNYRFFAQNTASVAFTDQRPARTDQSVLLCIPAAFTTLEKVAIQGIYGINGQLYNTERASARVGGLFVIHPDGHCTIEGTNMGQALTPDYLKQYEQPGYSLFQQIKIVADGKAPGFKDKSQFQRRALALDKNGALSVVESTDALTLAEFANDLAELGVWEAAYTDMGAWDEGWYRDAHSTPVTLGKDLSQTARQSNWVVFKTP